MALPPAVVSRSLHFDPIDMVFHSVAWVLTRKDQVWMAIVIEVLHEPTAFCRYVAHHELPNKAAKVCSHEHRF